jgi:hypothetical protein
MRERQITAYVPGPHYNTFVCNEEIEQNLRFSAPGSPMNRDRSHEIGPDSADSDCLTIHATREYFHAWTVNRAPARAITSGGSYRSVREKRPLPAIGSAANQQEGDADT